MHTPHLCSELHLTLVCSACSCVKPDKQSHDHSVKHVYHNTYHNKNNNNNNNNSTVFSFSALMLMVWRQEGRLVCKNHQQKPAAIVKHVNFHPHSAVGKNEVMSEIIYALNSRVRVCGNVGIYHNSL